MTKRERLVLGGILAVALVLRVAWSVYAARPPGPGLHDPNFYRLYGEQLANFNGYRLPGGIATAYYPPGFSFSLAPFFWIVYNTPIPDDVETGVIAMLNIAWQLGTIVLAFLIARRLTGHSSAGYVSAAVLALWPNLVFHTAVALSESFFLFLLLIVVLLVIDAPWTAQRWEPWRLVAVGAVLGGATLVRPVTIPVFAVLFVALLAAGSGWRRAIGHSGVVLAVALAVVAPWLIRNAIVMHQVTLSTNTGDNLCMSRRVGGSGGFELDNDRCFVGPFDELERPAFETARDAHGRRVAVDFVRDHPMEELRLVVRRIGHTFRDDADGLHAVESFGTDPFLSDGRRDLLRRGATAYGALAGLAGVAGLVVLARRRVPAALFVALTGVGMLLPPLAFFGDTRFHVPAVPVAAIGVGALVASVRYSATSRTT